MSMWYDILKEDIGIVDDEIHISLESTYQGNEYAVIKISDMLEAINKSKDDGTDV